MFAAIIAALGMTADGLAEGLYAVRHRFSARAASIGYAIGAGVGWFYNVVTPITFTVESIAVATRAVKKPPQILYVVALSAVPSIVLGLFGLYSTFVNWLDPAVVAGVIAGVGVILAGVGVGYVRERPYIAVPAVAAGVVGYVLTDNLVVVILASMAVGTAARYLVPERLQDKAKSDGESGDDGDTDGEDAEEPGVGLIPFQWRDMIAPAVLIGAFSVFALRTGAVVSYSRVNGELAGQEANLDGVTVMAGLASLGSGLLGGPPLETTPAPMAATPQPVFSTVLFMALMAVLLFFGAVGRLGRYVPLQGIAGFLIVTGIPVIMPENLPAVAEAPLVGGTALAITALSNPFYGLLAGQAVALLGIGG
ncbi:hypothetical protein [Blastococcus capsensis]|uniref:hypothetical protein n=1 Tax=Blastococcus capsensis TaxID=1564163 RepID=UPI002541D796|nr:hypothetical protein [Blastococcus capsensis]MDK3256057.1 hypothetical protein [Blastococcus capsensis]